MDAKDTIRILLVDDEAALTRLLQTYLSRIGYSVDSSLDAKGAFSQAEQSTKPYDLLVADITLPDMPGNEMALRMLDTSPSLRVLLCSGYPFDVTALPENVQHRCSALLKPFLPNMLAQAIEELLQRPLH